MNNKIHNFTLGAVLCCVVLVGQVRAAMLLEYTFEGNANNTGTTGASNNATISGTSGITPTFAGPASPAPGSTSSFNNSALTFNVVGDVLATGNITLGSTSATTSTSITFTGWLYNTSGGTAMGSGARILDKGGNTAGGFTLQIAGSALNLIVSNGTAATNATSSLNIFTPVNTWVWFGATFDATTGDVSFYNLNASNQVTLVNTVSTGVIGYKNNGNAIRLFNSSGGNRAYDGYADDIRLFNDLESVSAMQALAVSSIPEPATTAIFTSLASVGVVLFLRRKGRATVGK